MDLTICAMLLGAALLHASWHAMVKSSGDRLISLAGMNVVSGCLSLAALPWVDTPQKAVWPVLAFSVVLHNAYKIGLAQVYRHGDLVQAYPIARGLTPLFATLIAFLALGELPDARQAAGVLLVSGGILAMSLDGQGRKPTVALMVAAAATGLMVAAYTVVDAYGSRLSGDWLSFVVWLMILDGVAFVGITNVARGRALWTTIAREWRRTLISGLLGTAAFSVLLWALSHGPIAGVSALRETSVLFACLIGVFVLKERWSGARAVGVTLIAAGIVAFASRG